MDDYLKQAKSDDTVKEKGTLQDLDKELDKYFKKQATESKPDKRTLEDLSREIEEYYKDGPIM